MKETALLRMARKVVFNMDSPWKPKVGGRPAVDVKSMVVCCLFKYKFKYDYRGLESHLNAHKDLFTKVIIYNIDITIKEQIYKLYQRA